MLGGMDGAATTWAVLLLGVVLGLVVGAGLAALAALVGPAVRARRARRHGSSPPSAAVEETVDDLPGFLEHPPGSDGAARPAAREQFAVAPLWAPLAGPPAPAAVEPVPAGAGRLALGGAAATLVVLLGGAVAAAGMAASRGDRAPGEASREGVAAAPLPAVPPAPAPGDPGAGALADVAVPLGDDGLAAELAFSGVLLEQRAVGITAAYPEVRLRADGSRRAVAHVLLPTWNCFADTPPADPAAAGCARSLTEHADLAAPALRLTRQAEGFRLTGRFPTYLRPNGSPPEWTGRVYALTVTATPDGDPPATGGAVPATGSFEVGDDRARARLGSFLRYPG